MPANEWDVPNYWLSSIILNGEVKPIEIIKKLEIENIESRPLWKPMHLQPYYNKYDFIGSNISGELFENGLCLPSDTKISNNDLEKVTGIIKGLWKVHGTF